MLYHLCKGILKIIPVPYPQVTKKNYRENYLTLLQNKWSTKKKKKHPSIKNHNFPMVCILNLYHVGGLKNLKPIF